LCFGGGLFFATEAQIYTEYSICFCEFCVSVAVYFFDTEVKLYTEYFVDSVIFCVLWIFTPKARTNANSRRYCVF